MMQFLQAVFVIYVPIDVARIMHATSLHIEVHANKALKAQSALTLAHIQVPTRTHAISDGHPQPHEDSNEAI